MLLILISCIYISFLCWTWGLATCNLVERMTRETLSLSFSLTCLMGMVTITVLAGIISIWLPLGGLYIQLLFLIPALLIAFQKSTTARFRKHLRNFRQVNKAVLYFFISAALLLLIMGSWVIYHPDTLAYHLQLIKWIEEYKVVPGLVHLDGRYGFQSSWFVSCALFRFNFTNSGALTYINITILIWYLLFIITRINYSFFMKPAHSNRLFWFILVLFNFWGYTQIRLTATSASPDFIAFIFIGAIFYLLLSTRESRSTASVWVLILLLTAFTFTIKFSTIPIVIIGFFALFRLIQLKKLKLLTITCICSLLIVLPYQARNLITSGYPFYPSTFSDFFNVDWKYSTDSAIQQEKYVTTYARTRGGDSAEKIDRILAMSINEWGPTWWSNLSLADKIIIILAVISILTCLLFIKKIVRSSDAMKVALITALTGTLFWFIKAPDPRFGLGFIMILPFLTCLAFTNSFGSASLLRKLALWVLLISGLSLNIYSAYRIRSYFTPKQLIQTAGIEKPIFKTVACEGNEYQLGDEDNPCGDAPIPCVYDSCQRFLQRGKTIREGFRSR